MDIDAIRRSLFNHLRNHWGHQAFTASSFLDLLALIDDGLRKMVTDGRTTGPDLDLAKAALSRFIDEMSAEKDRHGFGEFREETVSFARGQLCPGLWPFC